VNITQFPKRGLTLSGHSFSLGCLMPSKGSDPFFGKSRGSAVVAAKVGARRWWVGLGGLIRVGGVGNTAELRQDLQHTVQVRQSRAEAVDKLVEQEFAVE